MQNNLPADSWRDQIISPQRREEILIKSQKGTQALSLEPLSVRQYFTSLATLYRDHMSTLASTTAIVSTPVYAVTLAGLFASALGFSGSTTLMTVFAFPFTILVHYFIPALLALIVANHISDQEIDLWETLSYGWKRVGAVLSSALAVLFCFIGGIVAGALPILVGSMALGVFIGPAASVAGFAAFFLLFTGLWVVTSLTPVVAVLEEKSGFAAVRRSATLVWRKGEPFIHSYLFYWFFLIGFTVLSFLFSYPIIGLLTSIVPYGSYAIQQAVFECTGILSSLIFSPAMCSIPVYLYFEQRRRYENYCLEEAGPNKNLPE